MMWPQAASIADTDCGGSTAFHPPDEALRTKGVPFLFASGYGSNGTVENRSAAPVLNKPFLTHDLEKALHGILA